MLDLNFSDEELDEIPHINYTNVRSLDLSGNNISNINRLDNLKELTILNLNGNIIRNFPLLTLSNLKELHIKDNKLKDIWYIHRLRSLTHLDIGYNKIRDISGIENLKNLKVLSLSGNKIKDISPLSSLLLYLKRKKKKQQNIDD